MMTHVLAQRRNEDERASALLLCASARDKWIWSASWLMFLAVVGCGPASQTPPPPESAAPTAEPAKSQAENVRDDRTLAQTQAVEPIEEPTPQQRQAEAPPDSAVPDEPQEVAPANDAMELAARDDAGGPQTRTAFYRMDANTPAAMPQVLLSKGDEARCRVKVGDTMPPIDLNQISGERKRLADLFGQTATVVVFWRLHQQLADLGPDVIKLFGDSGVAVVGIAVSESAAGAEAALEQARATFPNLLDSDGKAFAQVGSERLPRTYLLDPQGKILWFDIEYSLATRRELHQALRAATITSR
jgi:peroxiredoxin